MLNIFTHLKPDLDAVASVWYYSRFVVPKGEEINLAFVPANWDGASLEEGDVALDIEAGGKGEKGWKCPDGRVMSCFASLIESHGTDAQYAILHPLVEYVDAQDSTGDAVYELMKGFFVKVPVPPYTRHVEKYDIPASLRVGSLTALFRAIERLAAGNDSKTVLEMSRLFDAIYESGVEYREAIAESTKAVLIGDVAYLESSSKNPFIHARIFEQGSRVIVRLDLPNLAVMRRDTEKVNLGEIVRPFIEKTAPDEAKEWFYHSAGFLAARGTPKAPAKTPSRVNALALAEFIAGRL